MKLKKIEEPKMIFATIHWLIRKLTLLGIRIPSAPNEIVLEFYTKLDYAYFYFYNNRENANKMIGGYRLDSVDRRHFLKYLEDEFLRRKKSPHWKVFCNIVKRSNIAMKKLAIQTTLFFVKALFLLFTPILAFFNLEANVTWQSEPDL